MVTFNKFRHFVLGLVNGEHHLGASGDVVKVYLTNNAPDNENDVNKADLAGIAEKNGYVATDIQNDVSEATGTASMTGVDVEWTVDADEDGNGIGPFQYAVLYNDTHASDALIGWWDYGAPITLPNVGEKFKVDFGATVITLT